MYSTNPVVINAAFSKNVAYKGSAAYCYNSNPYIINSTISENTCPESYGGGIFCGAGSFAKIVNSILWGNTPHEVTLQGIYSPNSVEISYSDITDGQDGIYINGVGTIKWLEGNISESPEFVGIGEHPYQISDLSPCIDAGNPDTANLYLPEYGLDGNPRFVNDRVDMGAYEWNMMVGNEGNNLNTGQLLVYPNPASQKVRFSYKEGTLIREVRIFNQTGQKVYRGIPENNTLDISGLQPGMYIVEVESKEGNLRGKLIVK